MGFQWRSGLRVVILASVSVLSSKWIMVAAGLDWPPQNTLKVWSLWVIFMALVYSFSNLCELVFRLIRLSR